MQLRIGQHPRLQVINPIVALPSTRVDIAAII
jgi:hypothetical protein